MTLRYEGVRFSDGSIAVRRIAADPCDRETRTFEGLRELEEDIGSADVTWIADRGCAPPIAVATGVEICELALGEKPRPPAFAVGSAFLKCDRCDLPYPGRDMGPCPRCARGILRPSVGTGMPVPIEVRTEEDWRKHVGGRPPLWFLALPAEQTVVVVPLHAEEPPLRAIRAVDEFAMPLAPPEAVTSLRFGEVDRAAQHGLYVGDGHPALRASRYAPEPEDVEGI